jgi:glycosyltransferase involved in cell wall biosynthesis
LTYIHKISIVICCHNSTTRLLECLSRLHSALLDRDFVSAEVIVVDNASTDGTGKYAINLLSQLELPCSRVIRESRAGLMYARMAGIAVAAGEIICFVDDDNWLLPGYFSTVVKVFSEQSDVGFWGCSTRLPLDRTFPESIAPFARAFAIGELFTNTGILDQGKTVWGAGLAIRADILKELFISGFQPLLLGRSGGIQLAGDDSELCYIVGLAGWKGWYQREVLLEHAIDPGRMSIVKLEAMYRGFGASDSIQSRYVLILTGKKCRSLEYFVPWYLLKLSKNLCVSVFRLIENSEDLKPRFHLAKYIEAAKFLLLNKDIGSKFRNNLVCIKARLGLR